MSILLLQTMPLTGGFGDPMIGIIGGIMGAFVGIFAAFILSLFALYIYLSVVYSKIGNRTRSKCPGIAWMPYTGPLAVIFESSKMHWWPFLMTMAGLTGGYLLMLLSFAVGSSVLMVLATMIVLVIISIFTIMTTIWHWKTYKAVGKPGWWILVPIVSGVIAALFIRFTFPIPGMMIAILGMIAHLVLIGMAAWGQNSDK